MSERLFPSGFAEKPSLALNDQIMVADSADADESKRSTLDALSALFANGGELFEKIQRGGLMKPSEITFHGAYDYTSSFIYNASGWYTALPPMTGETKVAFFYAPNGIPFVPSGYPSGTQSINGNPIGDIVPFAQRGLYAVVGDGAIDWKVYFADATQVKVDLAGTHSVPGSGDDNTAGWSLESMILASNGKLYIATNVGTGAAVWVNVSGTDAAPAPDAYVKRWNRVDMTQFDALVNYSLTNASIDVAALGGAPSGIGIEIKADAASPGGIATRMFTELLPPEDCVLHLDFAYSSVDPGDDWYAGVLMFCDDQATCMMFGIRAGTSGAIEISIRAGGTGTPTVIVSGSSTNAARRMLRASMAGAYSGIPNIVLDALLKDTVTGLLNDAYITTDEIYWDPAWNTLTADRVGVFLYSGAGAANPVTVRMKRLDIERGAH